MSRPGVSVTGVLADAKPISISGNAGTTILLIIAALFLMLVKHEPEYLERSHLSTSDLTM